MDLDTRTQVAQALSELLQEAFIEANEVSLPGWGTFRVEHRPGQAKDQNGTVTLQPPQDVIVFEAK